VFRDGSVVLVPVPGHTPGSVIAFVNTPDNKRYAFVGDLVWQREGVELPAERPWLSRRLVDDDEAAVRREVARLHRLAQRNPDLVVVPAHDRRVLDTLPAFGP
jgi:N-acyl homoserine lactone hydrolase